MSAPSAPAFRSPLAAGANARDLKTLVGWGERRRIGHAVAILGRILLILQKQNGHGLAIFDLGRAQAKHPERRSLSLILLLPAGDSTQVRSNPRQT